MENPIEEKLQKNTIEKGLCFSIENEYKYSDTVIWMFMKIKIEW